jgi:hypothetical protein
VPRELPWLPLAFLAAADSARGANPLAAVDEPGIRAAVDCTLDAALPVIGEALPALFPPLLFAIFCLPCRGFTCLYTQGPASRADDLGHPRRTIHSRAWMSECGRSTEALTMVASLAVRTAAPAGIR